MTAAGRSSTGDAAVPALLDGNVTQDGGLTRFFKWPMAHHYRSFSLSTGFLSHATIDAPRHGPSSVQGTSWKFGRKKERERRRGGRGNCVYRISLSYRDQLRTAQQALLCGKAYVRLHSILTEDSLLISQQMQFLLPRIQNSYEKFATTNLPSTADY